MTNSEIKFFHELVNLAAEDLSLAHLKQHFTTAHLYLNQSGVSLESTGTWSTQKSFDTVQYKDGMLTGKKHWVSGVSQCDWGIISVKHSERYSIVFFNIKDATIEFVPTVGMEQTNTAHLIFNKAPATFLYDRQDSRCFSIDRRHHFCFVTNLLGLSRSLLTDIDKYTVGKFDYEKNKLKVDVEVLNLLWENELSTSDNQQAQWYNRDLIYAFGKKTLVNVTNFVTEVTGSGLYQPNTLGHQRFKDALIYSTHMKNIETAMNNLHTV